MYYNDYGTNQLPHLQNAQSLQLCWLPFSGCGREHGSLVFDFEGSQYIKKGQWLTKVTVLQLAVEYLNASISRITWKPEPEIDTDRSSQTWHNPQVNWYKSRVGLPRSSRSDIWMVLELNGTTFAICVCTAGGLPRPVANPTLVCPSLYN